MIVRTINCKYEDYDLSFKFSEYGYSGFPDGIRFSIKNSEGYLYTLKSGLANSDKFIRWAYQKHFNENIDDCNLWSLEIQDNFDDLSDEEIIELMKRWLFALIENDLISGRVINNFPNSIDGVLIKREMKKQKPD